jgi:hypothetical protein
MDRCPYKIVYKSVQHPSHAPARELGICRISPRNRRPESSRRADVNMVEKSAGSHNEGVLGRVVLGAPFSYTTQLMNRAYVMCVALLF